MAGMTTFDARIARINSGQQWEPEGIKMPSRGGRNSRKDISINPITMIFCATLGLTIVLLVRLARFHFLPAGILPANTMQEFLVYDAGAAFMLIIFVGLVASRNSAMKFLARATGVALGVLAMHMAVHAYPDVWAMAFSPAWVAEVIASTDPRFLLPVEVNIGA